MDIRFQTPFTYICAGASHCGKTTHVRNLLKSMPHMLTVVPDYVIYFYSQWQPIFSVMQKDRFDPYCCGAQTRPAPRSSYETVSTAPPLEQFGSGLTLDNGGNLARPIVNEWVNALPDTETLKAKCSPYTNNNGTLIVIDDFALELNTAIATLFTVQSHADNISSILLTQNLFSPKAVYRTISLNSMYISIFKNPRDKSQISTFAGQYAPGNSRWVTDAFNECTRAPYTYMLFDNHQSTPESVRVRSHILPGEDGPRVWMRSPRG